MAYQSVATIVQTSANWLWANPWAIVVSASALTVGTVGYHIWQAVIDVATDRDHPAQ
jgi:hypothetical protein